MFSSPRTGFLAVTSPERESVEQAVSFWELLEERNYRFVGTVVNRVEPAPPGRLVTPKELARIDGIDDALAARIAAAQQDHAALADRDQARLHELADATGDALTISVPRLARLVSDLAGLRALAPYLAD
jgi:MinD-like ATPase involved in chromosome partitioning or flagellar assembly